jgi:hypothetical protein
MKTITPGRYRSEDSFDPTEVGWTDRYDGVTQGRQLGSDPYDDPTQGRKLGSDPHDHPAAARPR